MGLLDEVLGAAAKSMLGGQGQGGASPLAGILQQLLGGQMGGGGGGGSPLGGLLGAAGGALGADKRHPMLDNRLSATINETLALFIEGLDAEAIAARRGLERSTVLGHFAEAIEAGLIEARQVVRLEESEIEEILAAFEKVGTVDSGKLGPAHAALGGRFDYGTLKCLLAEIA